MLRLRSRTDEGWGQRALGDLDTLLLDHAHLEKKAASTALTLIFRYPERGTLHRRLSELAREELEHFELCLDHLEGRGLRFTKLPAAPYAGKLMKQVRPQEPSRLLDTLLCCAIIEARSCERMQALAEALRGPEPALHDFYVELMRSEARHHALYVDMACELFEHEQVHARLATLMDHEATLIASAPTEARMHGG